MERNNNRNIFHIYKGTYEVNPSKQSNCVKESAGEEFLKGLKEPRIKARYFVILLIFMGQIIYFYQQISLSISVVAMINNSALPQEEDIPDSYSCPIDNNNQTNSSESIVEMEGEFAWSPKLQGFILGSGSFSMLTVPVFSRLAEIFGGKKILFWTLFLMSTFTFISPFAAQWNVYVLIVVQSLRGMSQAGIVPTEAILVANWCPKQERGLSYTLVLSGCCIGAIFGSFFSGLLCDSPNLGGWKSSFFLSGALGFLVCGLVWFFLYDNPSVHPKISPAELHYIISNQENALTEKRPKTPWKKLFTSIPVYALGCAYFGQMWTISHFLSMNPTFLKTILHFSVEQSGLIAALPFLLETISSQVSGVLSALLKRWNLMGIDKARKFWTCISCVGYSCCVLGICFAKCNTSVITVLSILAFGITGFANAGCWIVCNDMSPTFSASINAIAFTIGNVSYFILPFLVGQLTDKMQTLEQWHKVFYICIAVVLSSGIIFAVFGSAEIQPWNDVTEEEKSEKGSEMKSGCDNQIQISDDCNKDTEPRLNNKYELNVL